MYGRYYTLTTHRVNVFFPEPRENRHRACAVCWDAYPHPKLLSNLAKPYNSRHEYKHMDRGHRRGCSGDRRILLFQLETGYDYGLRHGYAAAGVGDQHRRNGPNRGERSTERF